MHKRIINGNLGNAKIWSAYNFKQMFPNNSPSGYGAVIRTFGTSEPHNFIGDSYYIASDQDGKFFTGVQTNGAELITWRDIALKSDFIVVNTDAILVEPGVTNIFISHKNIGRSTLDGKFISLIRGNSNLDVSETITATLTHGGDNIKTKVTIRNSGNTQREIKLNLLIIN